jgi:hypothetical protein
MNTTVFKQKSYLPYWRALLCGILVVLSIGSLAAQSRDEPIVIGLNKEAQARLIAKLAQFVEYDRKGLYEKQYDLYLPEFARLMFIAKDKEEYAKIFRAAGKSKERMIEFRTESLWMTDDRQYGEVCLVYGIAKSITNGKIFKSRIATKVILKDGNWFFVGLWRLTPD